MTLFSIDLEFWYDSPLLKKKTRPDFLRENIPNLIDVFKKYDISATFFVTGRVMEKYPGLIREIRSNGHEIGFHSADHTLISLKEPDDYGMECARYQKIAIDITGTKMYGHRAPCWSLNRKSSWLPEVLRDNGFIYDNSYHPVGFSDLYPHNTHLHPSGLLIIPQSVYRIADFGIPFTGSIFFRFLPYGTIRWMKRKTEKNADHVIFYTHPWEIFPPDINERLPLSFRLYNMSLTGHNRRKIKRLLSEHRGYRNTISDYAFRMLSSI